MSGLELAPYKEREADASTFLASLADQVESRLSAVEQAKAEVTRQYRDIMATLEGEEKPLRDALKGLKGTKPRKIATPSSRPVVTAAGTSTGWGLTYETAEVGVRFLLEHYPEAMFAQKDFYRAIDWDQSKCCQLFKFLRAIGFLRKAGIKDRREQWAIMDADAFDASWQRVKAEQEERFERIRQTGTIEDDDRDVRAAAFIRAQGTVVGWNEVQRACNISGTVLTTVRQNLLAVGVIRVDAKRGTRAHIQWVGQEEEIAA
jgi:hypothetical protein